MGRVGWGVGIVMGIIKMGIREPPKCPKIGLKSGSKIRVLGTPGRGVLRFLAGAYRRPVHFLPKNAFFTLFCQT